ncbi:MAG: D-glycero-alpha-D-manno-heptose 1-phosphate guanylyltransferase [Chlamydiales bacterium]|nr:D-glycero-alpha-D-manno-heptose 1-phosphate guanylyltransferase [Chlamydiales bacterium]MCH9635076.1 D-glycero-alpha-D-manno-heptose 1-phosphate guanylyltransferase [Chlamydiales bacterium]MCH9703865.1 nucleotidyltransferase family protein [Chlamydiota bacterium]
MEAIILAGGKGTRLREVVSDRPKPMAEIAGSPFLDIILEQLKGVASSVVLAVGYMGEQIVEHYQDRCLISSESKPLGTGGAVLNALPLIQGKEFLVLNGDSYFEISLHQFLEVDADLVMATRFVENTSRYGSIKMDGDRITAFEEKSASKGSGWINGGIYKMRKSLFEGIQGAFSLETEFFPKVLACGKRGVLYKSNGKFIDIGTPASFKKAGTMFEREIC